MSEAGALKQDQSDSEEELLAIMALPAVLPQKPPPRDGDRELVAMFLVHNGIERGRCPSVETCTLYRFYSEWQRLALAGHSLVRPFSFAVQMRRLGFRKKYDREGLGFYYVRQEAAKMLQRWGAERWEPDEYRAWFRSHFIRAK